VIQLLRLPRPWLESVISLFDQERASYWMPERQGKPLSLEVTRLGERLLISGGTGLFRAAVWLDSNGWEDAPDSLSWEFDGAAALQKAGAAGWLVQRAAVEPGSWDLLLPAGQRKRVRVQAGSQRSLVELLESTSWHHALSMSADEVTEILDGLRLVRAQTVSIEGGPSGVELAAEGPPGAPHFGYRIEGPTPTFSLSETHRPWPADLLLSAEGSVERWISKDPRLSTVVVPGRCVVFASPGDGDLSDELGSGTPWTQLVPSVDKEASDAVLTSLHAWLLEGLIRICQGQRDPCVTLDYGPNFVEVAHFTEDHLGGSLVTVPPEVSINFGPVAQSDVLRNARATVEETPGLTWLSEEEDGLFATVSYSVTEGALPALEAIRDVLALLQVAPLAGVPDELRVRSLVGGKPWIRIRPVLAARASTETNEGGG